MSYFFSQLINGLQSGSIYALVALGYSMVYGIIKLLNFAHGDIIMVGAYVIWLAVATWNLPLWVSLPLAVLACTVLGMLIEKVAYAPMRSAPRISILITAIGVSYLLENLAQLIFGAGAQTIPPLFSNDGFSVGDTYISYTAAITIVVAVISMVILTFLVQKTRLGKAMRAVSEDTGAAQLMGIPVNRTISFTFAVGSALAGIGAILYATAYPQATPTMGSMLGLKAFVAAVLGGIGSIPGAMIGGFAIGFAEVLASAMRLSVWKDGIVFAILIIVLLVKPSGIMGHEIQEKV